MHNTNPCSQEKYDSYQYIQCIKITQIPMLRMKISNSELMTFIKL